MVDFLIAERTSIRIGQTVQVVKCIVRLYRVPRDGFKTGDRLAAMGQHQTFSRLDTPRNMRRIPA